MSKSQIPWWRGERGAWYERLQIALVLLVVFGPATFASYPKWPMSTTWFGSVGTGLLVSGVALGATALRNLYPSITSSGALKPEAVLVTGGAYRYIRHPVYTAHMLFALGWSLALGGWLTLLYTLVLGIVLNRKSRMEEERLVQRFPEYRGYQAHTKKFVPYIY